jgi:hypothetical protein
MPAPNPNADPIPDPVNDPELREALTLDFLSGELHPAQLIRLYRISIDTFLAWWRHPQVQAKIASFREALDAHNELAAITNAYEGRATLLCLSRDLDHAEPARKSASLLFKARPQAHHAPSRAKAPTPSHTPSPTHPPTPAPPPSESTDLSLKPRYAGASLPCHTSFGAAAFTALLNEHDKLIADPGDPPESHAPPSHATARVVCHDS